MVQYHIVVLVFFCSIIDTLRLPKTNKLPTKMEYMKALNQTLHAMNGLLIFYEEQVNQVNLDAIYGLRVAEGSLVFSSTQHNVSFWKATTETNYIYRMLRKLSRQARSISNRAQASLKKQSKDYYYRFKDIVDKPWGFFNEFGYRRLPEGEVKPTKITDVNSYLDERISDKCMSEVLGTNSNHTECLFTLTCRKAITDLNQVGYGATHQILFLTLALMHGCEDKYSEDIKVRLGYGCNGLIEDRCVKIMSEMIGLEHPKVETRDRDLYIEQGLVCALHGYEEFLSLKRLADILSWQRGVGCYGYSNEDDDDVQEQAGILGNSKYRRNRKNVESFRSMRRLLVDVTVAHGCSAHESGVAVGLLGSYVNWLLFKLDRSGAKKLNAPKAEISTSLDAEIPMIASLDKPSHQNGITNANTIKSINDKNNIHENKNNDNNDSKKKGKNNTKNRLDASDREVYIRSMIISFITSLLTVAVVLVLYKLGEYCCSKRGSRRKYRPLIDA